MFCSSFVLCLNSGLEPVLVLYLAIFRLHVCEEQKTRFRQDIKVMEKRYRGWWNINIVPDQFIENKKKCIASVKTLNKKFFREKCYIMVRYFNG